MLRDCNEYCDVDGGRARRERDEAEMEHDRQTDDAWVKSFFDELEEKQ